MYLSRLLAVLALLTFISCSSDDDSSSSDPSLIGTWTTSCSRYMTDDFITSDTVCSDPDDSTAGGSTAEERTTCQELLENYYYIDTAVFANQVDDEVFPTLVYERTTYYNADSDDAALCGTADERATIAVTWDYQSNAAPLQSVFTVSTENGFPDNAKALNMQVSSAALTPKSDDMVTFLNAFEVCEQADWETDTEIDISEMDNCQFHITSLVESDSILQRSHDASWDSSDSYESSFTAGTPFYSIYKLDETEDPSQLGLGDSFNFLAGGEAYDATKETSETQQKIDGSNEARRENSFSETLEYSSE